MVHGYGCVPRSNCWKLLFGTVELVTGARKPLAEEFVRAASKTASFSPAPVLCRSVGWENLWWRAVYSLVGVEVEVVEALFARLIGLEARLEVVLLGGVDGLAECGGEQGAQGEEGCQELHDE